MGKKDEEFLMILDIDKVFSRDELAMVRQSKEAPVEALASAEEITEEMVQAPA
jgi:hypothetical protein